MPEGASAWLRAAALAFACTLSSTAPAISACLPTAPPSHPPGQIIDCLEEEEQEGQCPSGSQSAKALLEAELGCARGGGSRQTLGLWWQAQQAQGGTGQRLLFFTLSLCLAVCCLPAARIWITPTSLRRTLRPFAPRRCAVMLTLRAWCVAIGWPADCSKLLCTVLQPSGKEQGAGLGKAHHEVWILQQVN